MGNILLLFLVLFPMLLSACGVPAAAAETGDTGIG